MKVLDETVRTEERGSRANCGGAQKSPTAEEDDHRRGCT